MQNLFLEPHIVDAMSKTAIDDVDFTYSASLIVILKVEKCSLVPVKMKWRQQKFVRTGTEYETNEEVGLPPVKDSLFKVLSGVY